jgi:integrase
VGGLAAELETARGLRRIPFAWIGGSYRFTDDHVAEIIRRRVAAAIACWLPIAPGLTPHGLRHTYKMLMIELGTLPVLMDEQLGHLADGRSDRRVDRGARDASKTFSRNAPERVPETIQGWSSETENQP